MSVGLPDVRQLNLGPDSSGALLTPDEFVYRLTDTGSSKLVIREGDVYTTPLLPGFELPLDRLLGRADLWG